MQGVYKIRNKVNDKRYVGSTNDFKKGWKARSGALRKGSYHNEHLQRAWNKYGEENFAFEIEEEVVGNNKALLAVEQVYLDEGFELGILYNVARKAGGGNLGEEVNRKISKALKGQALGPPSEEHKAKGSAAKMGTECAAKSYPSFLNIFTGEVIPAGKNLSKLCRERGLCLESMRMVVKGIRKHACGCWVLNADEAKANVRLYPSFFNVKTGQTIPTCTNLSKLCREHGLNYANMVNLARGTTKQSYDGWGIATEKGSL